MFRGGLQVCATVAALGLSAHARAEPDTHHSATTIAAHAEAGDLTYTPSEHQRASVSTVEDLAQDTPGLYVLRHATEGKGAQFFARGFDAQHGTDIEVTLEGVPLNLHSHIHGHGYVDLSWLPTSAIGGLQFQGGAHRLEQGAFATAGSLDLQLPHYTGDTHLLRLRTNQFGSTRMAVHSHSQHGRITQLHASEYTLGLSYADRRFSSRGAALQQLRWRNDRDALHRVILAGGFTYFEVPTLLRRREVDAPGGVSPYQSYLDSLDGQAGNFRVQWAASRRLRAGLELDAKAALHVHHFRYDDNATGALQRPEGDTRHQREDRQSLYASTTLRQRLNRDHRLRWHGGAHYQHGRQSLAWVDHGYAAPGTEQATDFHLTHVFGGVTWESAFGRWLQARATLRGDLWLQQATERSADARFTAAIGALSPRASVRARVHDAVALLASVGVGLRPSDILTIIQSSEYQSIEQSADTALPSARARFGQGERAPTRATTADLGVHIQHETLDARVGLYGIWLQNESFYDHVAGLRFLLNPSRRLGVDGALTWRPHTRVALDGRWSFVDARFTGSGRRVPGAPRHHGGVSGEFELHRRLHASASARFVGARVLRYNAQAGAIALLDLRVEAQPTDWLSLRVTIENLLNTRVEEATYNFPSHWDASRPASQLPQLHTLYGTPRTVWLELRLAL